MGQASKGINFLLKSQTMKKVEAQGDLVVAQSDLVVEVDSVHQEEEDNGETVRETKVEIQNEDLDQIGQEDIEDVNSITI